MRHFLLLPLLLCSGCRATTEHADIIYTNAQIWTGNPEERMVEALAVSGETIVSVGSPAEIEKWKGPQTRVINLKGRFVVPGFIDNHTHFLQGGSQLASVNLRVAGTAAEFV